MSFAAPVACVYNPLHYARRAHEQYLALAHPKIDALFLGMNPGPFGMAQTGVPFGEVAAVTRFLGIQDGVTPPRVMHEKRLVTGFACRRSEVSGRRFWGLVEAEFGDASQFFQRGFVFNWCPLAFMTESGANLTPDRLTASEQAPLVEACDDSLRDAVEALSPRLVIGVGAFAARCAVRALGENAPEIVTLLHPSPASPAANRGWDAAARRTLRDCGFL